VVVKPVNLRDGNYGAAFWRVNGPRFRRVETLDWPTVRVLRYRQHKRDGTVIQAEWLTNFSFAKLGSLSFYRLAKSRWEIENQSFNDGKNHYDMEQHLPSPAQQHPDHLATDRTGLGDRTPVPVALSAPWGTRRSLRHGLIDLSLVDPGLSQSA